MLDALFRGEENKILLTEFLNSLFEGEKIISIYSSNELTREDYPTTVQVYPDGRFEASFLVTNPKTNYIIFKNDQFKFYIEPGQTPFLTA